MVKEFLIFYYLIKVIAFDRIKMLYSHEGVLF